MLGGAFVKRNAARNRAFISHEQARGASGKARPGPGYRGPVASIDRTALDPTAPGTDAGANGNVPVANAAAGQSRRAGGRGSLSLCRPVVAAGCRDFRP